MKVNYVSRFLGLRSYRKRKTQVPRSLPDTYLFRLCDPFREL